MAETFKRQGAQIYQFPLAHAKPGDTVQQRAQPLAKIEFGNGWYHDAAIAEEARLRKR